MMPALRALNRYGLGARPGEARRLDDPRGWLQAQLHGPPPLLDGADGLPDPARIADGFTALRRARREQDPDRLQEIRQELGRAAAAEARVALEARLASERPFVERLVAFWSNHLCVSAAGSPLVAPLAGAYERQAIRPHVLGRFEEMLLASARHPAMLLYLDNAGSVGPESPAGRMSRRRGPGRGLNENYARELLELHTVGVDGGYTQDDVLELARVLTGWSVTGLRDGEGGPGFVFRARIHEPGARTVLGRRYPEGGEEQGRAVIRDLARHPATARFLATKLVRHLVDDEPPAAAVERVAGVYRETDGDLREVARELVTLEEAWAPERLKFRTPQDWLVASLRALEVREGRDPLLRILRGLRQPLWAPPSPEGYGDRAREWNDPDALMNRAELARTVARRARVRSPAPGRVAELVPLADDDPLPGLLSDPDLPADEGLALVLAGPAFQWR
jgi:uncharacterized protein (DUF1800 family)